MLRRWFDVPASVSIDLADIDSAVVELGDPEMIAALAMRKLQALRLLADARCAHDDRCGRRHRERHRPRPVAGARPAAAPAVAGTDWDAALEQLSDSDSRRAARIRRTTCDAEAFDDDVALFRSLHQRLHEAAIAVVEASQGEIRIFE